MSNRRFAWEVAKGLVGLVIMLGSIWVTVYIAEFLINGG